MCVCASEKKRECVEVTDRDWECVRAHARMPVCESERERVCVRVKDRKRKKNRVCMRMCV